MSSDLGFSLHKNGNTLFYGKFDDHQEAYEYIYHNNLEVAHWNSDIWFQRQLNFYKSAIRGISPRPTMLPSTLQNIKVNSVIDLGGGSGWLGKMIPNSLDYYVIETDNYVEEAKGNATLNSINYIKKENSNVKKPILLYSNSTIQYVNDYIKFISQNSFNYVLLDDVLISSIQCWTLQIYYEKYFIRRIFTEKDIINEFLQNGYALINNLNYPRNITQMNDTLICQDGQLYKMLGSKSFLFKLL
jgi:putative methyltransferase (TIGR04325 family)